MARTCSVCTHEQRAIIDRIIAQGALSNRAVGRQFSLSKDAIANHARHLTESVVRSVQKADRTRKEVVQGDWGTKLANLHDAACRGIARAEADPDKWTAAAGFIAVGAKICDTGLRASGEIATGTTINVDRMLVLPLAAGEQQQQLAAGDVVDVDAIETDGETDI